MRLSDVAVKKLKPTGKTRKVSDGGGLYVEVAPSGGKLWRYAYRFDGKQKKLAIGKYPDVSLQEARRRHQEARELLAKGADPAAAKKAQKAAGTERAANTFEVVAREWFDRWKTDKAKGTAFRALSLLEKSVFPYIGGRPVSTVSAMDVLGILRRIEDRGVIETAQRAK